MYIALGWVDLRDWFGKQLSEKIGLLFLGKNMSRKISKAYAYTVRVDDKSTYDQVKKYLTHFKTLDHYKSERIIDQETDEDYIQIYVDFTGSIGLKPEKMYGAIFSKCKKIPKERLSQYSMDIIY